MCGLIGYYSKQKKISKDKLEKALHSIQHRGPDEHHIWRSQDGHVALGHARLSIIGVNNGSQPIFSRDKTICAVVNGEFYDYKEIKNDLLKKGFAFTTESDSEILIPLYQQYGIECLKYLNGEFSFILWDEKNNLLLAARDRFGIKPIFYSKINDEIFIASEIKAILKLGILPSWNHKAFLDFSFGIPNQTSSLFENINSIKPGHYLTIKPDSFSEHPYWEFEPKKNVDLDYKLATEHFLTLLKESVSRRLTADVNVGCYLSGGIDSASILAIAAQYKPDIKAFTISFDDTDYDEASYAEIIAKHLNIDLSILKVTQADLAKHYENAIYYRESLVYQTSGIAKFLLSKHVSNQSIKAVITGEGGDEVLAGYPSFKEDFLLNEFTQTDREILFSKLLGENARASAAYVSGNQYPELSDIHKFLGYTPSFLKLSCEISRVSSSILEPEILENCNPYAPFANSLKKTSLNELGYVEKSQYLWSKTFFPELILSYLGDRMEMAHSVEGRLPFLDTELVSFLNKLPTHYKINNELVEKCILRDAMAGLLPESIRLRTKHIFAAPPIIRREIHRNPIYNLMRDIFSDKAFRNMGIYNVENITRLLKNLPLMEAREKMITEFALNIALSTYFLKTCYKT